MYYFASEACIPVRTQPSEAAEMDTQLLFGDIVWGADTSGNWLRIKNLDDGMEGWVTKYMLTPMQEEEILAIRTWAYAHTHDCCLGLPDGSLLPLPRGARVPVLGQDESLTGKIFMIGGQKWQIYTPGFQAVLPFDLIGLTARKFLNTPYLWGGRGGFGLDCSGLVQTLYRMHGRQLSRNTSTQIQEGVAVPFAQARLGDLAFFSKAGENKVSHVGMMLGADEMIHSSGRVKLNRVNSEGIFSYEYQTFTHPLLTLKRYTEWEMQPEPKF